mgnify:FL=1
MKKNSLNSVHSVIILSVIAIVCFWSHNYLNELSIAMLFMIPILFSAIFNSQTQAIAIAFFSIAIFDFIFVHPKFDLAASNPSYFITFFIMFAIGQIVFRLSQNAALAKEMEVSKKIEDTLLELLSHELRTPLAVIKGCSSSLLNKDLILTKLDEKNLIENIDENAEEMDKLIWNLINSAKLKNGILKVKKDVCDIQDIVSSAIIKTEKDIPVLFEANQNQISNIAGNAILLEQAVINLLDNAFKYGYDVAAKIQEEEDSVVIIVSNKGGLQSLVDIEKAVKPFSRLSNSKNHRGLGLGLHVVSLISEIHGGKLVLSSDRSIFIASIFLPKNTK